MELRNSETRVGSLAILGIVIVIMSGCASPEVDPWSVEENVEDVVDRGRDYGDRMRESIRHMERAQRKRASGERRGAEEDYRIALEWNEENAEAHYGLATLLREERRFAESMEYHARAESLRPSKSEFANGAGITLLESGEPRAAIEKFERAAELAPRSSNVRIHSAWALYNIGRHDAAVDAARQATSLAPLDAHHHDDLGFLLYSLGRYDDASVALRRAIELDPDLASAHHNLGLTLTRGENGALARTAYERAVALAPERSRYHRSLGLELARLGESAAAESALRKALEISPYDEQIVAELAALESVEGSGATDATGIVTATPDSIRDAWTGGSPSRTESIADLIDMLKDDDWKIRHRAKVAIIDRGDDALALLRIGAESDDVEFAGICTQAARTIEASIASGEDPWKL